MPKVQITKMIKASPEVVWNFISDVEKAPQWVTVMQSLVASTDNPVKEGTVYRERSKVGPKASETSWTITRFEAPRIQIHECRESVFSATLTMSLEPIKDQTRLIHTTEYTLLPGFRPLGWLLEKLIVHKSMLLDLHESVEVCKQMIEAEAHLLTPQV